MLSPEEMQKYFPIGALCTTVSYNKGEIIEHRGEAVVIKSRFSTYVAWYKAVWSVTLHGSTNIFVHTNNLMRVYDKGTHYKLAYYYASLYARNKFKHTETGQQ